MPKMKRRQLTPSTVISLSRVTEMQGIRYQDGATTIGSGTLLREVVASRLVPEPLRLAAATVASPHVRNTATIGGNLCLDTRCNYIDMPEGWRIANGHCLKDGGDTCWVAPRQERCWAVHASDVSPIAIAMHTNVRLVSETGERIIPLEDLYANDGINNLTKRRDELLVELKIPSIEMRASYYKLRRRGAIDFALVGAAASFALEEAGSAEDVRIVLTGIASAPVRVFEAEQFLVAEGLSPGSIVEAAGIAGSCVRTQDNTDLGSRYRKWMIPVAVQRVLEGLAMNTNERSADRGTD